VGFPPYTTRRASTRLAPHKPCVNRAYTNLPAFASFAMMKAGKVNHNMM